MEVDAVRAELGEALHGLDRIERRARLVAERITTDVADGPQPEGEAVRGRRCVLIVHGLLAHGDLRSRACRGKRMLPAVTQFPPPPRTPANRRRLRSNAAGPAVPYPVRRSRRPRSVCGSRGSTGTTADYIFEFWSAFGWTVLTCGIYGFYIIYQLDAPRPRSHPAPARAARRGNDVRVGAGARAGPRRRAHARVRTHRTAARADTRGHDASSAIRSSGCIIDVDLRRDRPHRRVRPDGRRPRPPRPRRRRDRGRALRDLRAARRAGAAARSGPAEGPSTTTSRASW